MSRETRRIECLHRGVPRGRCQWCGEEVRHLEGKRAGEVNTRSNWHQDCLAEFKLHNWPDVQRRHVIHRDGERCRLCGDAPLKVLRGIEEVAPWPEALGWYSSPARRQAIMEKLGLLPGEYPATRYCPVEIGIDLAVDHRVPLWAVQGLEPRHRLPFHGPANLWLLCQVHHGAKTGGEAAIRAEARRAGEVTLTILAKLLGAAHLELRSGGVLVEVGPAGGATTGGPVLTWPL